MRHYLHISIAIATMFATSCLASPATAPALAVPTAAATQCVIRTDGINGWQPMSSDMFILDPDDFFVDFQSPDGTYRDVAFLCGDLATSIDADHAEFLSFEPTGFAKIIEGTEFTLAMTDDETLTLSGDLGGASLSVSRTEDGYKVQSEGFASIACEMNGSRADLDPKYDTFLVKYYPETEELSVVSQAFDNEPIQPAQ